MKFIRDLSNLALIEWLDDPVEEHPIWQAIAFLLNDNRTIEPWLITRELAGEAYRRNLVSIDTYNVMVG